MEREFGGKPQAFASGRDLLILTLIIVSGLLLRLPALKMGLWCDDLIALFVASQPNCSMLFSTLAEAEGNPPLYHLILSGWLHAFGNGEIVVKIPSLLFGLLYIVATYVLGRRIYSPAVGLIAALCAALSPQANYFACQARPHQLAALLICLALLTYLRLFQKAAVLSFCVFVLVATASLYTSYLTLFLFLALGIVTVLLEWRAFASGGNSSAQISFARLAPFGFALLLPVLLFAPWWHVVLEQMHGAKPVEAAPLSSWLLVFLFNLTTMIPLPLQVGVFLLPLSIIAAFLALALRLKTKTLSIADLRQSVVNWFKVVTPDQAFLFGASFIPAALIGIVTPFFVGYFRYIFPFSSGFWVLLAVISLRLLHLDKFDSGVSENKLSGQPLKISLVILLAVSAIDLFYLLDFAKLPESGMKVLANDVLAGRYDHSAILVAPDHGAMTLDYYLPPSQCQAHNVFLCGFPRWHTSKPETAGLPAFYLEDKVVEHAVDRIRGLSGQGYRRLLFANDHAYDNVVNAPIRERCKNLKDALSSLYPAQSSGQSIGRTETSDLTMFQLDAQKPQSK